MKKIIAFLLLTIFSTVNLYAQVPPIPTEGEDAGVPGAGDGKPVDQYLIGLAMFAVVFAIYYIVNARKTANAA